MEVVVLFLTFMFPPETKDELWNDYIIGSNLIDLFVFLELDKNVKNFNFDNKQKFLNEELPNPNEFIDSLQNFARKIISLSK